MAELAGVRILVFRVADLLCGAEVGAVREILSAESAVRVPGAPEAVLGLINVRGQLVTLVDGRRALGHPADGRGTVVLMDVGGRAVGFMVDEVLDLLTVSPDDLSDRRELPGVDPRLVRAVVRRGDSSFVLLDLDALLGPIFS